MATLASVTSDATSMLVSLALNAATAKHAAIAQNIANANNEGYRAVGVDFDERVAFFKDQLLDRRQDAASVRLLDTLRSSASVTEAPGTEASKVRLDMEVAKMTQNALHYQALLTARSKLTSLIRMAIGGGR